MDYLKSRLGSYSGGKILDVATRGGGFIEVLIGAFKDYDSIVGIDISDEEFAAASDKFKDARVEFMVMDAGQLTFADNTFDTVAMKNGLHHLPDIRVALAEMKRVLKPGSLFIIYEILSSHQNEKQLSDILNHNFALKIDRLKGETHNYTLERQAIIDHIDALKLSRYDSHDYHCTECDPESDEKMAERIKQLDDSLDEIRGFPEYEELKREGEQLKQRFKTVGYECAPNLIIIGTK